MGTEEIKDIDDLYRYGFSVFSHEDDLHSYSGHLYHYTTSDGLLGILQTQRIWATESFYLNDSSEIDYGLSLVKETISDTYLYPKGTQELGQPILMGVMQHLSNRTEEIYVACFSEDGDLLSQWKGYAGFGEGYSVEFDASELTRHKRKYPHVNVIISKVIYKREQQISMIKAQVDKILIECNKLATNDNNRQEIIDAGIVILIHMLRHMTIFFKDNAFSEEREWRATYVNNELSEEGRRDVKFRVVGGNIVPYLPLDIGASAQKDVWNLPISAIVFGSKVNIEMAKKSIQLVCKGLSIQAPEFRFSKIPLK